MFLLLVLITCEKLLLLCMEEPYNITLEQQKTIVIQMSFVVNNFS